MNTSLVSHAQQLGFGRAVYHKGPGARLSGFELHSSAPCRVTSGSGNVPPMGVIILPASQNFINSCLQNAQNSARHIHAK